MKIKHQMIYHIRHSVVSSVNFEKSWSLKISFSNTFYIKNYVLELTVK